MSWDPTCRLRDPIPAVPSPAPGSEPSLVWPSAFAAVRPPRQASPLLGREVRAPIFRPPCRRRRKPLAYAISAGCLYPPPTKRCPRHHCCCCRRHHVRRYRCRWCCSRRPYTLDRRARSNLSGGGNRNPNGDSPPVSGSCGKLVFPGAYVRSTGVGHRTPLPPA